MIAALLRVTEPTSGRICIDGVDIYTIGLHLLRSSLSVISQDAVLLAGTVRYNLDPFQQYDDSWLNECLKRVGLARSQEITEKTDLSDETNEVSSDSSDDKKDPIQGSGLTLDSDVKENGSNISQGQRALISIARALVRRSKIVILDEATASIDGKADTELQAMFTEMLGDATVITVAHRLDTIVSSSDRVVVMDGGAVAEFDTIPALFGKKDGLFRALCDAAKITIT